MCSSIQGGKIFDIIKVLTMWQSPFKMKTEEYPNSEDNPQNEDNA